MTRYNSPWLRCFAPRAQPALRLFAFHHGGGSATFIKGWDKELPASIEVVGVQLPGRAERFRDPHVTDVDSLIHEIAQAMQHYQNAPFAFFGHSLGAMLSFELTRYLVDFHRVQPVHLFVSGRHAPQLRGIVPPLHHLPDDAFIEQVGAFGGLQSEVLEHKELLEMILPGLRADFKLSASYRYQPAPPLPCPITAMGGMQDATVPLEKIQGWRDQTSNAFDVKTFDGGHFYLEGNRGEMLDFLAKTCTRAIRGRA